MFPGAQTGGALRIVVPDPGLIVREYQQSDAPMASHDFVQRLGLAHSVHDLLHPGAHHSQMFDEKSLRHLFREAGFASSEVKAFMESRIPDIVQAELEVRKNESLYAEGPIRPREL